MYQNVICISFTSNFMLVITFPIPLLDKLLFGVISCVIPSDCSVDIEPSESFVHGGELPTLIVQSSGHALHVFVNGQLSGIQSNCSLSNV